MSLNRSISKVYGKVIKSLSNLMFSVEVDSFVDPIICYLSGKMRLNYIRVLPGDTVCVELRTGDLHKGRIVKRVK